MTTPSHSGRAACCLAALLLAGGAWADTADTTSDAAPVETPAAAAESATDSDAASAPATDAAPAADPVSLGELRIHVSRADGTPIAGAKVLVSYADGTERRAKTDDQGEARLSALPYGDIEVDVTATGMQSAAGRLTIDADSLQTGFELKPRPLPPPASD